MSVTIFNTPVITPILRAIAHLGLRLVGWRVEGGVPPARKFVLIAAPHTSNWDAPLMLAFALILRMELRWFVKATVFRPPWGPILRWMGAIGVDRSKATNLVSQAIARFSVEEDFVLAVPPEGTRRAARYWKSGFYHIAHGAEVPISLGFLDFGRKVGSVGQLFHPTGDIYADMGKLREFYTPITACYPEKKGPIEVAPAEAAVEKPKS